MMTSKIVVLDYNRDLEMLIVDTEYHYKTIDEAREAFDNWFDDVDSKWGWDVEQPDDYMWVVKSYGEVNHIVKLVNIEKNENEDWTDAYLR